MTKSILLFTLLLVICILFTVEAIPTRGNPGGANVRTDIFKLMDANQDGMLDKAEVRAYLVSVGCPENVVDQVVADVFEREDLNKDGFISRQEHDSAASNVGSAVASGIGAAIGSRVANRSPAAGNRLAAMAGRTFSLEEDSEADDEDEENDFDVDLERDFTHQYFQLEECFDNEEYNNPSCSYALFFNEEANVYYICIGEKNDAEDDLKNKITCRAVEIY